MVQRNNISKNNENLNEKTKKIIEKRKNYTSKTKKLIQKKQKKPCKCDIDYVRYFLNYVALT